MPHERPAAGRDRDRDRGGAATRARILEAAERVVREHGLSRATTKEIARAAGCSEAALYKHYADKSDLVLAMIMNRPGGFPQHVAGLRGQAGRLDVEATLVDLAERAVDFFGRAMPVGNALLGDPQLLEQYRRRLDAIGAGPRKPIEMLADYLRAERDLGRLRKDADPEAAAAVLLGTCFHTAFLGVFLGDGAGSDVPAFARSIVSVLMLGLAP